jgi:hypothetical protein
MMLRLVSDVNNKRRQGRKIPIPMWGRLATRPTSRPQFSWTFAGYRPSGTDDENRSSVRMVPVITVHRGLSLPECISLLGTQDLAHKAMVCPTARTRASAPPAEIRRRNTNANTKGFPVPAILPTEGVSAPVAAQSPNPALVPWLDLRAYKIAA